jgi:predicted GTPase
VVCAAFNQEVVPGMGEASLLADALGQLDQPFLLVVVGEFNSGKSSAINALLGGRWLDEGILPTTNQVAVLRYRRAHARLLYCTETCARG